MKRLLQFLVTFAILAMGAAAIAAPASASSNLTILNNANKVVAQAFWYTSSQTILLTDNDPDGLGQVSDWTRGANVGSCVNEKGAGQSDSCPLSFGVGKSFTYRLCLKNGPTRIGCTGYLPDVT